MLQSSLDGGAQGRWRGGNPRWGEQQNKVSAQTEQASEKEPHGGDFRRLLQYLFVAGN